MTTTLFFRPLAIIIFCFSLFISSNAFCQYLEEKEDMNRKMYTIIFNPRYHPRKTIKDYIRYMFTPKPLDELTSPFTPLEVAAIKEGFIAQGMRKDAVLACYGPPSERNTRGLEATPGSTLSEKERS
jgi:hypothetical protein